MRRRLIIVGLVVLAVGVGFAAGWGSYELRRWLFGRDAGVLLEFDNGPVASIQLPKELYITSLRMTDDDIVLIQGAGDFGLYLTLAVVREPGPGLCGVRRFMDPDQDVYPPKPRSTITVGQTPYEVHIESNQGFSALNKARGIWVSGDTFEDMPWPEDLTRRILEGIEVRRPEQE